MITDKKVGDYLNYYDWKSKNKYKRKRFSILGDSISTLESYNPDGYNVFYDEEHCFYADIKSMSDTWWGKVIDFFGGELLVNNSWSGSRVTKLPQLNTLFPSGCSKERTSSLHMDRRHPDVIIIYMGTNDWANGVEIDTDEGLLYNMKFFCDAYKTMIQQIQSNYPNAELWCCTLSETKIIKNSSFRFPHKYGGIHMEQYNDVIRNISQTCNCKLIDLYKYGLPYDTIDGSHPTKSGMNTLATIVIRTIGGEEINPFLDCENDEHQYEMIEENTGWGRYVCKKCGKRC